MRNGDIWYDMREKVYDKKIPVHICFNPQGNLEFIELYPQSFDLNAMQSWKNWTPEDAQKDKTYCVDWLMRFCGLQSEENLFSWGAISAYFAPRSYSSGS